MLIVLVCIISATHSAHFSTRIIRQYNLQFTILIPKVIQPGQHSLQAGNPAPVVDRSDPAYPKGRLFLFYNTGNNHESEIRNGKGVREVWYKTSLDNGFTWSAGVNITTQTHRPMQPTANPLYNFKEDELLQHNLLNSNPRIATKMEQFIKAYIQSFNQRMIANKLTIN